MVYKSSPTKLPLCIANYKSLILTSGPAESELPAMQHMGKKGKKAQRESPFPENNSFQRVRSLAVSASMPSDMSVLGNSITYESFSFSSICTHLPSSHLVQRGSCWCPKL